MISKSKLGTIVFVAAIGLASPAFAQMQANAIGKGPVADPSSLHMVAYYGSSAIGGGSAATIAAWPPIAS